MLEQKNCLAPSSKVISLCYNIFVIVVFPKILKGVRGMDKDTLLKEMIYNVSDKIGTDISYISAGQNSYQYLTGMDFTMILAAGISSMFFIPLITAFSNKLGEELADTTIKRLKKIANRSKKQLQERDTDNEIIIAFIKMIPNEILTAPLQALTEQEHETIKNRQIASVQDFLENNHFPHEKAKLLAEQIYTAMNDTITDAIDESE